MFVVVSFILNHPVCWLLYFNIWQQSLYICYSALNVKYPCKHVVMCHHWAGSGPMLSASAQNRPSDDMFTRSVPARWPVICPGKTTFLLPQDRLEVARYSLLSDVIPPYSLTCTFVDPASCLWMPPARVSLTYHVTAQCVAGWSLGGYNNNRHQKRKHPNAPHFW